MIDPDPHDHHSSMAVIDEPLRDAPIAPPGHEMSSQTPTPTAAHPDLSFDVAWPTAGVDAFLRDCLVGALNVFPPATLTQFNFSLAGGDPDQMERLIANSLKDSSTNRHLLDPAIRVDEIPLSSADWPRFDGQVYRGDFEDDGGGPVIRYRSTEGADGTTVVSVFVASLRQGECALFRNRIESHARLTDWKERVRAAADANAINWNYHTFDVATAHARQPRPFDLWSADGPPPWCLPHESPRREYESMEEFVVVTPGDVVRIVGSGGHLLSALNSVSSRDGERVGHFCVGVDDGSGLGVGVMLEPGTSPQAMERAVAAGLRDQFFLGRTMVFPLPQSDSVQVRVVAVPAVDFSDSRLVACASFAAYGQARAHYLELMKGGR